MVLQCPICLENVLIPVEITIFPCTKNQGMHCFSMNRICEACAILYCEQDKPRSERSESKKCIFCDCFVNLQLVISIPYKKDYLSMSQDLRPDISCPCCEFKGTHIELDRHMNQDCPLRIETCMCGKKDARKIICGSDHQQHCSFFQQCTHCQEYISIHNYQKHLSNDHCLNYCKLCNEAFPSHLLNHLEKECKMRIIPCTHCSREIIAFNYFDHLIMHTNEAKRRIELLQEMKESEILLYHKFTSELEKLYEYTYGCTLED